MNETSSDGTAHRWDRFWFAPEPVRSIARIRGMICLLTALYFISCWADIAFWYTADRPFSPENLARFWRIAGLEREARWNLSPLFLTSQSLVYQLYLVVGVSCCLAVAAGRGGRILACLLWLMLVGWANRAMMLSGLTETLLSLGLFACAIAPSASAWTTDESRSHWTARLSRQLTAVQISLVGVATFATMLGGRVWFNGLGAYALAAPWQDRTINWTEGQSMLATGTIHELLTHLLVIALPIGLTLAWIPSTTRYGKAALMLWCLLVALLGSVWLYAAVFAVMVCAIQPTRRELNAGSQ